MEKWEIPILILKATRPPRRRKGRGTGQGAVVPWSAERIFHLPAVRPGWFFRKRYRRVGDPYAAAREIRRRGTDREIEKA